MILHYYLSQVTPKRDVMNSLILIPLFTGQLLLPRIQLIWDRKKAPVLDINGGGPGDNARFVFVQSA